MDLTIEAQKDGETEEEYGKKHPIDAYFSQFDKVQPVFINCHGCMKDTVIMQGYMVETGLTLPKYCPSCGRELSQIAGENTPSRSKN